MYIWVGVFACIWLLLMHFYGTWGIRVSMARLMNYFVGILGVSGITLLSRNNTVYIADLNIFKSSSGNEAAHHK